MPVLHYRRASNPGQSRYYIKCLKDGGYQTWQLAPLGAAALTQNGIYGDTEFSWEIMKVLIDAGLAYLNDPEAAKARWRERVESAFAADPLSADARYGYILEWLKAKKAEGA